MLQRILFTVLLVAGLILSTQAASAQPSTFTVFPFAIHGPDKYHYLSQGIPSMLTSRLTWPEHLVPAEASHTTQKESLITSVSQAKKMKEQINTDYLIWGSVTIMDQQSSLDINILKPDGKVLAKNDQSSLDQLIPRLEEISQEINSELFRRKEKGQDTQVKQQQASASPQNPELVYNKPQTNQTSTLNPSFRYEQSGRRPGRWRSQSLPFESVGMTVVDADADGRKDIFILAEHSVKAYHFKQNRLAPLSEYSLDLRTRCLNINHLDLDRDGYVEIIVSAIHNDEAMASFILNFKQNEFHVVEKGINYFLNVVRTPPEFSSTLIGQKKGKSRLFQGGVHEMVHMSGSYQLGREINLPTHANIFNFSFLPQKEGYKTIISDNQDHLKVYSSGGNLQAQTQKTYAGSSIKLKASGVPLGLEEDINDPVQFYYIPTRMVPCNLDKDDRFELLVNRNISVASKFFSRYRVFPQGEIHNLYWDGLGLDLYWKTRTIQGSIMDYGLGDYNNDQQKELYVCVNTYPGAAGLRHRRTIVLGYSLKLDQAGAQGSIIKKEEAEEKNK